ncbi:polygalacturonase At1g48100 isoform X2 [Medicago truncatula]|uniref:Polygalacturonase n=1 Tax=Medicago truncatula TaxID=3880 RepID=A0A072U630_MEDTR|nr:polygalacturonase At1g48100 isoform X2 [Medicago truncatula]KEH24801.1 polygalacturonase [Medicago truncatula]
MKTMNINTITLIITTAFLVLFSCLERCSATRGHSWRKLKATSSTFNVLDFGAKGDGHSDDTKAFEDAWAAACKMEASTMVVPSGSVFLVKPISFSGPNCEPNIVFQLDGKIIAPTSPSAWGSGTLQWLEFTKLNKITIKGKGVIDGQGSVWWNDSEKLPKTKPTALRFYGSDGVSVSGITIQNSQQTHLKFDSCTNVQVFDITTSSPGDSPNTDGIHLQNSQDVVISGSTLSCGHGISIGSLGKENTKACVSNVTVRDVTLQNTLTGVRIKTWQGGSGSVQNIMFSNIQVSDVKTPIMIDQFYCDGGKCRNVTSAVAVSSIHYTNVHGTYTKEPIYFACSDSLPCKGITLDTIKLESSQNSNVPFCWKAYGELKTEIVPPVDCLQRGNPSSGGITSNKESSC